MKNSFLSLVVREKHQRKWQCIKGVFLWGAWESEIILSGWLCTVSSKLVAKNLPANTGDVRDSSSIPGSGRSPGVGNGNPLQYSCLGNPMDRGVWWARLHRVTTSRTRLKWLSMHTSKQELWSSEFPSISSSHLALVLYSQRIWLALVPGSWEGI